MINKAVILAAGRGTRFLPYTKANPKEMIAVVDKPALQLVVEEVVESNIKDILIVISHEKDAVKQYFSKDQKLEEFLLSRQKFAELEVVKDLHKMANIQFTYQENAGGSGEAVMLAKEFANGEAVAVLNGDDVMYTENNKSVTSQLCECFCRNKTSVIGVQEVERSAISKYGAIEIISQQGRDIKIKGIVEKPQPQDAPSLFAALGRYIISGDFFDFLGRTQRAKNGELQFTDALKLQAAEKGIFAHEFCGKRYDLGDKLGYIKAVAEYGLRHKEIGRDFEKYILALAEAIKKND